ncbi:putative zinc ribbon protein [Microbacterium sp. SLBN-154]|uniref:zinc-ribbon domain-containing protein n=1 Tax=Microbacterium sp. SLBN-154 TaxID=2768458 RepID=UPI001150F66B|nr:zinc-ribbon domain-containing protein [Microbacterium sp. SLBN-154]TQK17539.1 putative zinc ribbon protein [Microbacterium sp. SLBN-154]
MAERVELWWARRQFSRGAEVPYAVGTYREAWAAYPAVARQYHPDLNAGIALSQIPPAADVLLRWQCDAGHLFAATPAEQRSRPGRVRRRSAWCPECLDAATGRGAFPALTLMAPGIEAAPPSLSPSPPSSPSPPPTLAAPARARASRPQRPRTRPRRICEKTPDLPSGTSFASACAPKPASAAEALLHERLFGALAVTRGHTAVRVSRPFFEHREVWPDLVLPELRIAVEYDTIGRFGLEHVGAREDSDRRKDRLLREAGWEVVRLRSGKLEKLGPYDLQITTAGPRTVGLLLDAFRGIRGPLLIDAYAT